MIWILLSIAIFVTVFAFTVIVLTLQRASAADRLAKLNAQKEACTMLRHAIEYLTPYGIGENLEWSNARAILESRIYEVIYS